MPVLEETVKTLHSSSPEVIDLIRAMGLETEGLVKAVLTIEVGHMVTMVADYRRELWMSDGRKIKEFCKTYEVKLKEVAP